jgi:hypothetical protein
MWPPRMDMLLMRGENEFEDEKELEEDEVQQPAHGRPWQYNRNARPPPRSVRDDEHVAKLKLNILPFEGRCNPDAHVTWELEVEQRFVVYAILSICVLVLLLVNLQKSPLRSNFCPLKFSDREILCDIHLYLAVKLFLCACCRHALTCWCSRLASLVRCSLGPSLYRC